ncbi:hypothetical protein [Streptomyces albus]|uniref:hypothetical protein n=1 Tax=Streptomyces albus TaxID=1888 RepID=UPI003F1D7A06
MTLPEQPGDSSGVPLRAWPEESGMLPPIGAEVSTAVTTRCARRRRELLEAAVISPGGFIVATYELTATPVKPQATLAALREFAQSKGWRVHPEDFWDCGRARRPFDRESWARLDRLLRAGLVQGVVTLTERAISALADEYEQVLDVFRSRFTFVAQVPATWRVSLPGPTRTPQTAARTLRARRDRLFSSSEPPDCSEPTGHGRGAEAVRVAERDMGPET